MYKVYITDKFGNKSIIEVGSLKNLLHLMLALSHGARDFYQSIRIGERGNNVLNFEAMAKKQGLDWGIYKVVMSIPAWKNDSLVEYFNDIEGMCSLFLCFPKTKIDTATVNDSLIVDNKR